jgi:ribosome biogenesis GTPase A
VRQWITDTPGLMWPKIEHDSDGYMLAASHAIGRNAVIDEEVAAFLADILLARYPGRLAERYALEAGSLPGGVAVVEGIARRRALRTRGGEPDIERASLALLQDYRDGRLGRVSLETPQTRQAMRQREMENENRESDAHLSIPDA